MRAPQADTSTPANSAVWGADAQLARLEVLASGPAKAHCGGGCNGASQLTGSTSIRDGAWHHVAVTYGSASIKLYVDGVQDASTATPLNSGSIASIWVGSAQSSGAVELLGLVQQLQLWRVQLPDWMVAAVHSGEPPSLRGHSMSTGPKDALHTIHWRRHYNKCLQPLNGAASAGTNIVIVECDLAEIGPQAFVHEGSADSGQLRLAQDTSLCIHASASAGANVQLAACTSCIIHLCSRTYPHAGGGYQGWVQHL